MASPAQPDPRPGRADLPGLAQWLASESLLFADEQSPFRARVAPGSPDLLLITGENASGKSLFFRALCTKVRDAGPLAVTLSIRERAGAGAGEMSRMRQVFMFGDESEQSTGATSVESIRKAFAKNLDREDGTVLGLDEPELGLSDGYARALGTFIGQQAATLPAACSGVVVVTHSRSLVASLVEAFGQQPTHAHLGGTSAGIPQWLEQVETRTVEDLLQLADVGRQRWRQTQDLLRG